MQDKYVEKFRPLRSFLIAYMRDVTYTMNPDIQALSPGARTIGRAFTVSGPDIYLNALESIAEGSIYVHGGASDRDAVWSGRYADRYGRERGLVGTVIDGGIHCRTETVECDIPTFARFVSPRPAVNRKEGIIQAPVVCGGVTVCAGDIVLGDEDGVVVIPKANEEDIYNKVDRFLEGLRFLLRIGDQSGGVWTEHEALSEIFALKYANPFDYWRHYEPWAEKWRHKYPREYESASDDPLGHSGQRGFGKRTPGNE